MPFLHLCMLAQVTNPCHMLRPYSHSRSLQLILCSSSSFAPRHCKHSLTSACQCFTLSNTAMLEWVLYLALTLDIPGISPGSADQCILGNMFQDSTIQDMPATMSFVWASGCLCSESSLICVSLIRSQLLISDSSTPCGNQQVCFVTLR